jgi:hypothetical protein
MGALQENFATLLSLPKRVALAPWRALRWFGRKWRWTASVLALLLVAHAAATIITGHMVAREIQRIKARGEPVSLTDLAGPKVPDDQNAAVLYQKAFPLLPSDDEQTQIADFIGAGRTERPPVSLASAEEIVARSAPFYRLIEQAAARPECRFPVNWKAGMAALFPHLAKARAATRMMAAKALVDARRGDTGAAVSDIALIFRLADQVSAEPTLITKLVGFACQAIAVNTLNGVMEIAPPSKHDARRMYEVLAKVDNARSFVRGLEGERCLGFWVFNYLRRDPAGAWQTLMMDLSDRPAAQRGKHLARLLGPPLLFLWQPSLNEDEILFIRQWDGLLAATRLPYGQAQREYDALEKRAGNLPRYAVVTRILSPAYARATVARDRATALTRLAQCAMALRACQIATGGYPASLGELRHQVNWDIPLDPFGGKDFVYRREGKGYLLYSIGPDLKDDGGMDYRMWKSLPPSRRPRWEYGLGGDIAWRMPR